jgi:mono/diheme cytochrome c family protein
MRAILILACLTLPACMPEVPDPTTVAAGRRAFVEDCVACHGADARGPGPWPPTSTRVPPISRASARAMAASSRATP